MILNRLETLLMNNPLRRWSQHHVEAPRLKRLCPIATDGKRALVIGCGRGVDVEVALERFSVSEVHAFDLDPRQVERAARWLRRRYPGRARLWIGSATEIAAPAAAYDLVFDFGIIHHVPAWRDAVSEVARVLRPGGAFLFEEVPGHKITSWRYRLLLDHPQEDRFEASDFVAACEQSGLQVGDRLETFFGFFFGVAVRE